MHSGAEYSENDGSECEHKQAANLAAAFELLLRRGLFAGFSGLQDSLSDF